MSYIVEKIGVSNTLQAKMYVTSWKIIFPSCNNAKANVHVKVTASNKSKDNGN